MGRAGSPPPRWECRKTEGRGGRFPTCRVSGADGEKMGRAGSPPPRREQNICVAETELLPGVLHIAKHVLNISAKVIFSKHEKTH
jgi:hypothetical protein